MRSGDDPTALTALATATTLLLGDLDRAGHFVDRALALDANNAWAWSRRGFIEAYSGRAEPAIAAFEHAMRLSPLDPFSFNSHNGMGFANFVLGRYDLAIEWTLRGMREKAGMTWAHRDLAVYYALAGQMDDAKRSIAELVETRPGLTVAKVGEALRFVEPAALRRYLEGLKLAGLPDRRQADFFSARVHSSMPEASAKSLATAEAGSGGEKRKPCASVQPCWRTSSSWASVSTPSAVVDMPSERPRPMTAATIARLSSLADRSFTNDWSILILVEGEGAQITQDE